MEKRNESRKWKTAGRFPAEILFLTGFLVGNIIPNLIWKMEWKQKTLASFYLIRNFAGKDISGGAYLLEVLRHRGVLFLFLFFCGFTIFGGTAVSGLYADSWDGDRTYPDFIRAGIWYLRRCGRGRTSDSSVCDLYSGVFLSCWSCIQTVL